MINEDCFDRLPKIKEKIDLVLVDLPFNQTALKWDKEPFDLKTMWIELKKICKRDCIYVFFCTTKFGYKLIQSNERWFRYDLVWEKSRKVGFLSANKMPLRKHEMVYIFADANDDDLENNRNLGLREYFKSVMQFTKKTKTEITNECGQSTDHCLRIKSTQFGLPTEKTYDKLIEKYNLQDMPEFREYQSLKDEWEKILQGTYNPQKTEGKPYKIQEGNITDGHVYDKIKRGSIDNKGDRHPTTILKFNNPKKSLHRTAKPVDLCEWLIKTYSNEGENVLDFTMGSGSTGIACLNTNRNFIGIEKDETIFKLAQHRLFKHELCQILKNDQ